jgi:glyoxylase-like metal-dependent hydrolase (beta-lactamase superfamily II)
MCTSPEQMTWIHGAHDCSHTADPFLQVQVVDDDTYILRQSKCFSFEGPFIYLLFGDERALLLDTGAQSDKGGPTEPLPLWSTVDGLIAQRAAKLHREPVDLIVAHTHHHGDHYAWDSQFTGRPEIEVVPLNVDEVKSYFHLPQWPEGQATLNLGGREVIVLPTPGHEDAHITMYDTRTQFLLTGDTLYPGWLTVRNWPAYLHSARRLQQFVTEHPVSLVLGGHVEAEKRPRKMYPYGTRFQPDEHPLPLKVSHVHAWHAACEAMGSAPHDDTHDDFVIQLMDGVIL